MGNYQYRFTVFTPAYNRANLIERLYRSLQRQDFTDFEWLVVDDGSTDHTEKLFEKFLQEDNPFPIRYLKQENGGKHRALNRGIREAGGELFFIVDSDDYVTDGALKEADRTEKTIPAQLKSSFAGICGQKGDESGTAFGTTFAGDVLDITYLQREEYGISGDKGEIFYTEVLRKFPFPEFEGEKFLTECVVWDKIGAAGFKYRYVQPIFATCEYLPDGLSAQGQDSLFEKNPKGYGRFLSQRMKYEHWPRKKRLEYLMDYYYRYRDRIPMGEMAAVLEQSPLRLWIIIRLEQIYMKLFDR